MQRKKSDDGELSQGTKLGAIAVLKQYFGYREGDKLTDFNRELKQLSHDERMELAVAAAKELGLSQASVGFALN